jgi:ATP-dependent phosphoenolpyruvate carboxykinase
VYNRPFAADKFEVLYDRMLGFMQGKDVFVQDVYGGADESYRLPVRIVTELAWHSHFVRNMFILPQSLEDINVRLVYDHRHAIFKARRWDSTEAIRLSVCRLKKNLPLLEIQHTQVR